MSKFDFINNITRTFHKANFQLKVHSPEILLAAGIVGTVASAVMACKATTKVNDILEKKKAEVEKVHQVLEDENITEEQYSVEDSKKDLTIIYAKTGLDFVKLYAPSVILGALSITSILAGHNILRQRNVALAAAYTAIDTGFKEYRNRVVERFGQELDKELRYNIKAEEVDEIVVNEDGTQQVVKRTVNVADPNVYSDYARFFDCGNIGWTNDPTYNLMFVKNQQNYANDLLHSRGYLFLNEVYDMFGIPRTKAGQIVGWIYDEKNPTGDNFVDFGIFNTNNPRTRDFVNGFEKSVLMDFNVDGPILDRIRNL
jgi:hypothetical protein